MPVSSLAVQFMGVGFPTWVLVNALWTELAIFADRLPEGYDIGAYLMLALTMSNVAPAVMHMIVRKQTIEAQKQNIWWVTLLGVITTILLASCWSITAPIGNEEYSVPLFVLAVAAGATCNTTNVTHYSFVGHYERQCTSLLSFGAGMGSFFVGILALLQYTFIGKQYLSVALFFSICLIPWVISSLSLPRIPVDNAATSASKQLLGPESAAESANRDCEFDDKEVDETGGRLSDDAPVAALVSEKDFLTRFRVLLCVHFLICGLGYGLIPAVISVVCGKFSSGAGTLLVWSTVLVCFFDPIARGLTYKFATHRFGMLMLIWGAGALMVLFPLTVSRRSAFFSNPASGALVVAAYVVFMSAFSYTVTCHFLYIHAEMQRLHATPSLNSAAYSWVGVITQCASVVGTLLAFLVVLLA